MPNMINKMVFPMLIEFSVENFKSIKEEARLSLVASHGGEHRESHLVTPDMIGGVRVDTLVRSAAIYGANAAGKSNLVEALKLMRRIVIASSADLDELPSLRSGSTLPARLRLRRSKSCVLRMASDISTIQSYSRGCN